MSPGFWFIMKIATKTTRN